LKVHVGSSRSFVGPAKKILGKKNADTVLGFFCFTKSIKEQASRLYIRMVIVIYLSMSLLLRKRECFVAKTSIEEESTDYR
jgi:hypothetical protein